MKKLSLLLCLITASLFVGCSSDDDTPVIDQSSIPGTWNLTDVRSENGKVSATIQGVPVSGDYSVDGKDYDASITFTEGTSENDANTVAATGGFTLVATVTIPTQDPVEVEETIPSVIGSGEWTVDGNTLTTTVQGETQNYEIVELTGTSMTLKIEIDETRTIEQLGNIEAAITGEQFFVLTKQ
ncbi:lipocalin family protein [Aquimarina sp. D1M17]|uniref:lipocalin family protein n=1 Tax=Aquimarina acroporae TaxID=2937283 RepID=UPI0020BEBB46|nr:lipocalin family protein [Aquimarina acroporae]MCK8522291.1 lipocalin family protein [Aquimarina acroporae]